MATIHRKLTRFLRRRGANPVEIEAAATDGSLTLLAIDRLLTPGRPNLDITELARRSGVPVETQQRLWRALGFPDAPLSEPVFTEEAVEVLRLLHDRAEGSLFTDDDPDALVAQVRAVGAGLSRVAETLSDQIVEGVLAARASGLDDATIAYGVMETFDWPVLARLNDYALRTQLRAATWRKLHAPTTAAGEFPSLAVGFCDLVGYTALSQELDGGELAALLARFETVTYDTVAQLGARLVKTIGDEVMFVAEDPEIALRVALALTDRTRDDDVLPRARAGLAWGPALAREGDYYGSVVNLAHRLVEIARPASVVVSAEFADALEGAEEFAFTRLRSRKIRDIGRVEIYLAAAARESGLSR